MQQVLAYESDLLEYDDLFAGSTVVEAEVERLLKGARAEIGTVQRMGGAVAAVESGYMKSAMVGAHALRRHRIESGEQVVVGVNRFRSTEPSPLTADLDTAIQGLDPDVEARAVEAVVRWRAERDRTGAVEARVAGAAARRRRVRDQPHGGVAAAARGPASPPASGRERCARCSGSTARRPG